MNNITQPVLPGLQPVGSGPIVLTSNGVPAATLSPQEFLLYSSLFKIALGPKAIQTESTIPAATAANFLKRSGLSKKLLHDIWCIADPTDSGFLTAEGFYKACRLVGHAQCGSTSVTADLICQEPPSLPFFEGSDNGPEGLWKPSESEMKTFATLFEKEGGSSKMDGSDARALLLRSGLSHSELCDIWDLADTDRDGKLMFGEFVAAMVLVSRVRDGKAFIPPQLPGPLKELLNITLSDASSTYKVAPPTVLLPPSAKEPVMGFGSERPPTSPFVREMETSPRMRPESVVKPEPTLLDQELVMERRGLTESFGRNRELRKQVIEGRARLASIKEDAKKIEIELVSADAEAQRVGDQILSLKHQIAETEDELETFRREAGQAVLYAGGTNSDVVQAVASIRESVGESEREVMELRAQIERVQREKIDLQSNLSVLQEKKRQSDQDRNLMIVGLENERAKLVAVRAERLKLWEQRHQLTRELTTKTFEQMNPKVAQSGLILPSTASLSPAKSGLVRDRKGVKAESVSPPHTETWSQFAHT